MNAKKCEERIYRRITVIKKICHKNGNNVNYH